MACNAAATRWSYRWSRSSRMPRSAVGGHRAPESRVLVDQADVLITAMHSRLKMKVRRRTQYVARRACSPPRTADARDAGDLPLRGAGVGGARRLARCRRRVRRRACGQRAGRALPSRELVNPPGHLPVLSRLALTTGTGVLFQSARGKRHITTRLVIRVEPGPVGSLG